MKKILNTLCALVAAVSLEGCAHSVPEIKHLPMEGKDYICLGQPTDQCEGDAKNLAEAYITGTTTNKGLPLFKYHCVEGKPVGKQYLNYPDGRPEMEYFYNESGSLKWMKFFYDSGALKSLYFYRDDGLREEIDLNEKGELTDLYYVLPPPNATEENIRTEFVTGHDRIGFSWRADGELFHIISYCEINFVGPGQSYSLNKEGDGFTDIRHNGGCAKYCSENTPEECPRDYTQKAAEDESFRRLHLFLAKEQGKAARAQALKTLEESGSMVLNK